MAEITRPSIRATGVSTGPIMSLAGLSGGYRHHADTDRYPGELSPQEIVERLHEEIAAQSPRHAALVAEYRQKRERGECA